MKSYGIARAAFIISIVLASPCFAYRFGNPGKILNPGQISAGVSLETGERGLEADRSPSLDVNLTGLSFEGRYGLGKGLELRGRLIPMTLEWDFDGSTYSPSVLGLGAGLQWIPEGQKGPLTWGLGGGLDWGTGKDNGYDLDYLDILLNGGLSYSVDKKMDVYGGLSYIQSDITLKSSLAKSDLKTDVPVGLYGGFNVKPQPQWMLGVELRLMNETMLSLSGAYTF